MSWPWTLMVNGISSLQPKACTFVFCQFTSNPRDAALLAVVSNMGTRSSSSSARRETSSVKYRSVNQLWPNATPIKQDSTVLSSNQSMPVANESGASTQTGHTCLTHSCLLSGEDQPYVTHASALLLSSTFCLNVWIFLMFVRHISQSHRWKTCLIMLMFATSLLLLKKPIFTFNYNVVICFSCYSVIFNLYCSAYSVCFNFTSNGSK